MNNISSDYNMRLKYNHKSLLDSFEKFYEASNEANNHKIYTSIGELLLWIMTSDEWHRVHGGENYSNLRSEDPEGKLLLGMAHAFNSFKHNMNFFKIHTKRGGMSFPISFPLVFKPVVIEWMEAGDILEGKHPNQKKNYIKYLEGKDVEETFRSVISFLSKEYSKINIE